MAGGPAQPRGDAVALRAAHGRRDLRSAEGGAAGGAGDARRGGGGDRRRRGGDAGPRRRASRTSATASSTPAAPAATAAAASTSRPPRRWSPRRRARRSPSTATARCRAARGAPTCSPSWGSRSTCGPKQAGAALDRLGIAFLFAPLLHPAMREVMPVRRELGVRTIFNLLGPLTNPAGARRQVMGVYAEELVEVIARRARRAGERARARRARQRRPGRDHDHRPDAGRRGARRRDHDLPARARGARPAPGAARGARWAASRARTPSRCGACWRARPARSPTSRRSMPRPRSTWRAWRRISRRASSGRGRRWLRAPRRAKLEELRAFGGGRDCALRRRRPTSWRGSPRRRRERLGSREPARSSAAAAGASAADRGREPFPRRPGTAPRPRDHRRDQARFAALAGGSLARPRAGASIPSARPSSTRRTGPRRSRWSSSRTSSAAATSCCAPASGPPGCRRSPRTSWSTTRQLEWAKEAGADAVLLIAALSLARRAARAMPGAARALGLAPLIETHDAARPRAPGRRELGAGRRQQPRSRHLRGGSRARRGAARRACRPRRCGWRRAASRRPPTWRACAPRASRPSWSASRCCAPRTRPPSCGSSPVIERRQAGAVRVKICGVTSAADARRAADGGADFIGLNFFPGEPALPLRRRRPRDRRRGARQGRPGGSVRQRAGGAGGGDRGARRARLAAVPRRRGGGGPRRLRRAGDQGGALRRPPGRRGAGGLRRGSGASCSSPAIRGSTAAPARSGTSGRPPTRRPRSRSCSPAAWGRATCGARCARRGRGGSTSARGSNRRRE